MKYKYLSYVLTEELPCFGRLEKINIRSVKSLNKGDSCNTFNFEIENHWGTHIDCPAHFFKDGLSVTDYPPETWFFYKPFVLELALKENQLILPKDLEIIPDNIDILLIKSNFSQFRGEEKYYNSNPGFTPETGEFLREKHPSIRAIGFDFISLSPYQNRNIGRKAHQSFLDPEKNNSPVLIIEDMKLNFDFSDLANLIVIPLLINGLDSAPCTVIGIFK